MDLTRVGVLEQPSPVATPLLLHQIGGLGNPFLGFDDDAPADTARGFTTRVGYLAWDRARTSGAHHWEHLQSVRPQLIVFWYRSSPRPLVTPVLSLFGDAPLTLAASSAEAITAIDAASLAPGGSYLELDPDGALNALVVMPSGGDARTAANGPPSREPAPSVPAQFLDPDPARLSDRPKHSG